MIFSHVLYQLSYLARAEEYNRGRKRIVTGFSDSPLFQTARYNLLPWLPVLPLLPGIVLWAERWPMDQGRWKRSLPLHLIAMPGLHLFPSDVSARMMVAMSVKSLDFGFMLGKMLSIRFAIDALV